MNGDAIKTCGGLVIAGGVVWGAGMLWAGPLADDELARPELVGSLVWQIGILALLAVMAATRATGSGRFARSMLIVAAALVLLASGWTVAHIVDPDMVDAGTMLALDIAWPLSMLWLLVVAIVVAAVNQWTGRARWAPLIAKVYAAVAIVALVILPQTPALLVQSVAVAGFYGWLGWVIRTDVASGRALRQPVTPMSEPPSMMQSAS